MKRTIWILGDQLGPDNAALAGARKKDDVLLFVESERALRKLKYHQQRLVLLLSAQRHAAEELRRAGWTVDYHALGRGVTWESALTAHVKKHKPERILLTQPNNYDEQAAAEKLTKNTSSGGGPATIKWLASAPLSANCSSGLNSAKSAY